MPTIPSTDCTYEEINHSSAEIGLAIKADTAVDLFTCAAQAMFHLMQPGPVIRIDPNANAMAGSHLF